MEFIPFFDLNRTSGKEFYEFSFQLYQHLIDNIGSYIYVDLIIEHHIGLFIGWALIKFLLLRTSCTMPKIDAHNIA